MSDVAGPQTHPASGELALFALCGELLVAIVAAPIQTIRQVAETQARAGDAGGWLVSTDDGIVPGWDLGELLGQGSSDAAWVVADVPQVARIALRVGRCLTVHALPPCRPIPAGIFQARGEALAAGFAATSVTELAAHVAGVVVELAHLLGPRERGWIARLGSHGRDRAG
jgi:hypothetical protein